MAPDTREGGPEGPERLEGPGEDLAILRALQGVETSEQLALKKTPESFVSVTFAIPRQHEHTFRTILESINKHTLKNNQSHGFLTTGEDIYIGDPDSETMYITVISPSIENITTLRQWLDHQKIGISGAISLAPPLLYTPDGVHPLKSHHSAHYATAYAQNDAIGHIVPKPGTGAPPMSIPPSTAPSLYSFDPIESYEPIESKRRPMEGPCACLIINPNSLIEADAQEVLMQHLRLHAHEGHFFILEHQGMIMLTATAIERPEDELVIIADSIMNSLNQHASEHSLSLESKPTFYIASGQVKHSGDKRFGISELPDLTDFAEFGEEDGILLVDSLSQQIADSHERKGSLIEIDTEETGTPRLTRITKVESVPNPKRAIPRKFFPTSAAQWLGVALDQENPLIMVEAERGLGKTETQRELLAERAHKIAVVKASFKDGNRNIEGSLGAIVDHMLPNSPLLLGEERAVQLYYSHPHLISPSTQEILSFFNPSNPLEVSTLGIEQIQFAFIRFGTESRTVSAITDVLMNKIRAAKVEPPENEQDQVRNLTCDKLLGLLAEDPENTISKPAHAHDINQVLAGQPIYIAEIEARKQLNSIEEFAGLSYPEKLAFAGQDPSKVRELQDIALAILIFVSANTGKAAMLQIEDFHHAEESALEQVVEIMQAHLNRGGRVLTSMREIEVYHPQALTDFLEANGAAKITINADSGLNFAEDTDLARDFILKCLPEKFENDTLGPWYLELAKKAGSSPEDLKNFVAGLLDANAFYREGGQNGVIQVLDSELDKVINQKPEEYCNSRINHLKKGPSNAYEAAVCLALLGGEASIAEFELIALYVCGASSGTYRAAIEGPLLGHGFIEKSGGKIQFIYEPLQAYLLEPSTTEQTKQARLSQLMLARVRNQLSDKSRLQLLNLRASDTDSPVRDSDQMHWEDHLKSAEAVFMNMSKANNLRGTYDTAQTILATPAIKSILEALESSQLIVTERIPEIHRLAVLALKELARSAALIGRIAEAKGAVKRLEAIRAHNTQIHEGELGAQIPLETHLTETQVLSYQPEHMALDTSIQDEIDRLVEIRRQALRAIHVTPELIGTQNIETLYGHVDVGVEAYRAQLVEDFTQTIRYLLYQRNVSPKILIDRVSLNLCRFNNAFLTGAPNAEKVKPLIAQMEEALEEIAELLPPKEKVMMQMKIAFRKRDLEETERLFTEACDGTFQNDHAKFEAIEAGTPSTLVDIPSQAYLESYRLWARGRYYDVEGILKKRVRRKTDASFNVDFSETREVLSLPPAEAEAYWEVRDIDLDVLYGCLTQPKTTLNHLKMVTDSIGYNAWEELSDLLIIFEKLEAIRKSNKDSFSAHSAQAIIEQTALLKQFLGQPTLEDQKTQEALRLLAEGWRIATIAGTHSSAVRMAKMYSDLLVRVFRSTKNPDLINDALNSYLHRFQTSSAELSGSPYEWYLPLGRLIAIAQAITHSESLSERQDLLEIAIEDIKTMNAHPHIQSIFAADAKDKAMQGRVGYYALGSIKRIIEHLGGSSAFERIMQAPEGTKTALDLEQIPDFNDHNVFPMLRPDITKRVLEYAEGIADGEEKDWKMAPLAA